ncbi:hypothetical protein [Nocardioides sp. SYSU DS0651]|uniref:hypothetical protein n=1 Tax=Nocardioides sp. SYSU DS0651 TaxID=3415955 RepID=UPI003F4BE46B
MELHETIRELVDAHGKSIFSDATGFRGVLDDVLAEDQATTGDINLLVDAVRFDALSPLVEMIDGGADPGRAVEEAGLRLARNRGGDDQAASSWASAVLGYAAGKVPEAVVMRYRSSRPASSHLPPPGTAAPGAPSGPPVQSPPSTVWPSGGVPGQTAGPPTVLPGHGSAPQPGQPAYGQPTFAQPGYGQSGGFGQPHGAGAPSAPGAPFGSPAGYGTPPKKKGPWVWVAAAVAGVVVVAGGVTGVVLATGGDDNGGKKAGGSGQSEDVPDVDVDPAAIDERYSSLATRITSGATECKAGEPGSGEKEAVECSVNGGTLRLVTYNDEQALTAARTTRLDHRAGTLSTDNGATALYLFDPANAGSSDPALVYWDSKNGPQAATITSTGGAELDTLKAVYTSSSPRVTEPVNPGHKVLRDFININMDVSTCSRQATFFDGETEENTCNVNVDGVAVSVGRFSTKKGLREHRKFYKSQYNKAKEKGGAPTWKFGEGPNEGAYYGYSDGETATVYWDWNNSDCHCYGIAYNFDGDLKLLENWWPSDPK